MVCTQQVTGQVSKTKKKEISFILTSQNYSTTESLRNKSKWEYCPFHLPDNILLANILGLENPLRKSQEDQVGGGKKSGTALLNNYHSDFPLKPPPPPQKSEWPINCDWFSQCVFKTSSSKTKTCLNWLTSSRFISKHIRISHTTSDDTQTKQSRTYLCMQMLDTVLDLTRVQNKGKRYLPLTFCTALWRACFILLHDSGINFTSWFSKGVSCKSILSWDLKSILTQCASSFEILLGSIWNKNISTDSLNGLFDRQ